MDRETLLVCSTFPEIETARRIAQQLVTEKLAACANIIPAIESIYCWQDKIENSAETLVFFKTTTERYGVFQEKLKSLHPYEVPEIICVPITDGLPEYLLWVSEGCSAR
jgi:periplasmic divalent cation tolerance protein